MIETSLFEGKMIRMAGNRTDVDLQVISSWTYDLEIARRFLEKPARPVSAYELKKFFEAAQKRVKKRYIRFGSPFSRSIMVKSRACFQSMPGCGLTAAC
jgi:hypothetical protein